MGNPGRQARCSSCGRQMSEHDELARFRLPDPVLELFEAERTARTWGSNVAMQVDGVGCSSGLCCPSCSPVATRSLTDCGFASAPTIYAKRS